ncbi:MAG TPA: hypothetical protein VK194_02375 [Candidatus Deferrimicrobium sp.]|nr:hypothetical protein [Candidatus Deferrimicrobium sp.]
MYVDPTTPAGTRASRLSGTAEEMADAVRAFRNAGFTRVELMLDPGTMAALDSLAPVVELVRADQGL